MLKAILSKLQINLILNEDFLEETVQQFIGTITDRTFEYDLQITSREDYTNNKKNYKKEIVLTNFEPLNIPKSIDVKELKIEEQIVNTFLTESVSKASLRDLKFNIQKVFDISVIICEYIDHKGKSTIISKHVLDYLESTKDIIITPQYLEFLIDIIKNYHQIPVKLALPHYTGIF